MDTCNQTNKMELLQELLKDRYQNTVVAEYVNWFTEMREANMQDELFMNSYYPIIQANAGKDRVFASVVMRTQGRRPEALREALLSLYAQTYRNFEVLLIGHKLK